MEMIFVEADDKLVNLEHVSSINILPDKLALDLSCVAEINSNGEKRLISYYAYSHNNITNILNHDYVKKNFIKANGVLINKNHISVIKFVDSLKRVIFNLSHSVTSAGYNKEHRLTSKFIYADFNDLDEYNDYVNEIKGIING